MPSYRLIVVALSLILGLSGFAAGIGPAMEVFGVTVPALRIGPEGEPFGLALAPLGVVP